MSKYKNKQPNNSLINSLNDMVKNTEDGTAQHVAWRETGRLIGKEDLKLAGMEEEDADKCHRWRQIYGMGATWRKTIFFRAVSSFRLVLQICFSAHNLNTHSNTLSSLSSVNYKI